MNRLLKDIRRWERSLRDRRHLQHFESSVYSQNGEDGMIAEALRRLGVDSPGFVEFGASDGRENCTRNILENGGRGLWLEGDPALVSIASAENAGKNVEVMQAFLTRENIVELISGSSMRDGFDVLVVDIDGNDWWLADLILDRWSPRLVVTEYNPARGPIEEWVMSYDPTHEWAHDDHYGASLRGYERMMERHGYRLVACDSSAVNALWVKTSDVALFTDRPGASNQFVPALPGSRHRPRGSGTVDSPLDIDAITVSDHRVRRLRGCARELHSVVVRNNTQEAISSFGAMPIRIGLSSGDASEPIRMFIDEEIAAGARGLACTVLDKGTLPTSLAVVQEGVGWGTAIKL